MGATPMNFSEALMHLKNGKKLTRLGWNGSGQYVEMQVPTDNSKMTLPYFYITTVHHHMVPWVASQTDMLTDDWAIIE